MDLSYFQKLNNTYGSSSHQETDLYLLNRQVDRCFADTIDYHIVKKNGLPFELIIIKDTDGNTFKKKIKSKHEQPFNLGDYIEWNNQIWIITLIDPDEKVYHSGYMYLCTTILRWQNSLGQIIERFAYMEDFTKYSDGTSGNATMTLGDNQYGAIIPIDIETRQLKRDMRFVIDFDSSEQPDVYKLTNRKVSLNNNEYFGRGGTMVAAFSYTEFNKEKDKHINFNGKDVWICDYISPTAPPDPQTNPDKTTVHLTISSTKDKLKVGGNYTNFTGIVTDANDNALEKIGSWTIDCGFLDKVTTSISGNQIKIKIADSFTNLAGEAFDLKFTIGNTYVSKTISITD